MRLLVTGGAGYIGAVVAAILAEEGHDVTVVDDLSAGRHDGIPDGVRFVRADLRDRDTVIDGMASGFDAVLHLAARSLVGESAREPARYFRENVGIAVNLVEAMRAAGVPRIVFSSTAAVYGEPRDLPIREDAPTRPTNAYGASKLAVDHLLEFSAPAYGIGAVSLRYFNVAGAYRRHGEWHDPETHLVPRVLDVAAGRAPAVPVYGTDFPTPDGTAVRDYLHVEDLARAHLLALAAAEPGTHAVYNLGNGEGFSVHEVVEVARAVTGRPVPSVPSPRRPGDPARLVASSARARDELGWEPRKADLSRIVGDAWSLRYQEASA